MKAFRLVAITTLVCSANATSANQEQIAAIAAAEYIDYLRAPTKCVGRSATKFAQLGIGRFHEWKFEYDRNGHPSDHSFAAAAESFSYLFNQLKCRDGLIMYRYAYLLGQDDQRDAAISLLKLSLEGLRTHYPKLEKRARIKYGDMLVASNSLEDAVAQYRKAVELELNDGQAKLRLALALEKYGDQCEAKLMAESALKYRLTPLEIGVAEGISRYRASP